MAHKIPQTTAQRQEATRKTGLDASRLLGARADTGKLFTHGRYAAWRQAVRGVVQRKAGYALLLLALTLCACDHSTNAPVPIGTFKNPPNTRQVDAWDSPEGHHDHTIPRTR